MTIEGRALLALLADWQELPAGVRADNAGVTALAAARYDDGDTHFIGSHRALWDVSTLSAPLPIPFVFARGQA
jgi:hypothetical protein